MICFHSACFMQKVKSKRVPFAKSVFDFRFNTGFRGRPSPACAIQKVNATNFEVIHISV